MKLFITGTDTNVGKTVVTTLLTDLLSNEIASVFPYKPIQSGTEDSTIVADKQVYQLAMDNPSALYDSYELKRAYSPHLAASLENITINTDSLKQKITQLEKEYDLVIIEGAGGVYVPIKENGYSMIHFIKELQSPTILVADAGLGTINHTVLSIKALESKNIPVIGVILNCAEQDHCLEKDNIHMIQTLTNVPVIGSVPLINNINDYLSSETKRKSLISNWNLSLIKKSINLGVSQ